MNYKIIFKYTLIFFLTLSILSFYMYIIGDEIFLIIFLIILLSLFNIAINNNVKIFSFIVIIMIFLSIDVLIVYQNNQSFNEDFRDLYIQNNNDKYDCIINTFNNQNVLFEMYQYHTPKSNLLLPTLGIKYKENYEEEKGIVVVYEKRSYLNIYVGEGKVLCKSEGNLETLE